MLRRFNDTRLGRHDLSGPNRSSNSRQHAAGSASWSVAGARAATESGTACSAVNIAGLKAHICINSAVAVATAAAWSTTATAAGDTAAVAAGAATVTAAVAAVAAAVAVELPPPIPAPPTAAILLLSFFLQPKLLSCLPISRMQQHVKPCSFCGDGDHVSWRCPELVAPLRQEGMMKPPPGQPMGGDEDAVERRGTGQHRTVPKPEPSLYI